MVRSADGSSVARTKTSAPTRSGVCNSALRLPSAHWESVAFSTKKFSLKSHPEISTRRLDSSVPCEAIALPLQRIRQNCGQTRSVVALHRKELRRYVEGSRD